MATPAEKYQYDLQNNGFTYDSSQQMAVSKLNGLYERLTAPKPAQATRRSWSSFTRLFGVQHEEKRPERGLYFWGGVGRGKTYLMDTFYETLPIKNKLRVHFHRFMQLVHQQLNELKGEKDPLEIVAANLQRQATVICFDEFFVKDIGDAMILGKLLDALFRRGVCLVCTSNIIPDSLYLDGLQRQRFLPAIALLNEHTEVVNIDGGVDYRLRSLEQAQLYYTPLGEAAELSLQKSFRKLALEDGCHGTELLINGRQLYAKQRAEDVIWFDFQALCDGPRSQNDYIELAREFHAVLISDLPVLTTSTEDQARRFISLIDEFYDRRVKVIISAASPIYKIYQGNLLKFEFERTESRLLEMQSHDYLAAEHRA